jgi:hypothetical protein
VAAARQIAVEARQDLLPLTAQLRVLRGHDD